MDKFASHNRLGFTAPLRKPSGLEVGKLPLLASVRKGAMLAPDEAEPLVDFDWGVSNLLLVVGFRPLLEGFSPPK